MVGSDQPDPSSRRGNPNGVIIPTRLQRAPFRSGANRIAQRPSLATRADGGAKHGRRKLDRAAHAHSGACGNNNGRGQKLSVTGGGRKPLIASLSAHCGLKQLSDFLEGLAKNAEETLASSEIMHYSG